MVFIRIDVSEVRALAADIKQNADLVEPKTLEIIALGGHAVVADAQALVSVVTGTLKNSIGVEVEGLKFEAGPTAEYGGYVEEGTGPHAIPNAFGYGPDFGTESDFHPGTAPQPYMGPAFDRQEPTIIEAIARLGESILD